MNNSFGPTIYPTFTVATAPAANTVPVGMPFFFSDLGQYGTVVVSNGTRWKPLGGQAVLKDLGAGVAGITNAESMVMQTLLPINAWQVNDTLRIWLTPGKSGTTDTFNGSVYVGTAGTNADAAVISNQVWMTAANVGGGLIFDIKLISATTAQRLGSGPAAGAASYSAASATAQSAAVVIASAATNALYVSVGVKSSGATNTVSAQSGQIQLITP